MLDYLKRLLIAGIVALCVSLLFFGGKPQASNLEKPVDWIWPTDGTISDTYGTRLGAHKGIDIAGSINTPIYAVDNGIVSKSYHSGTYGHVIFIKHENNFETVYAHLNKRNVDVGQRVKKGDIIGRMGNTGESNGVHLHFEVHEKEWTFDKENAFNPTQILGNVAIGNLVHATIDDNAQFVLKNVKSIDNQISTLSNDSKHTYIVKKGDNLTAISKKINHSVDEIKSFNQLNSDVIYPDQIIKIPDNQ